jgi:hypothetical protein
MKSRPKKKISTTDQARRSAGSEASHSAPVKSRQYLIPLATSEKFITKTKPSRAPTATQAPKPWRESWSKRNQKRRSKPRPLPMRPCSAASMATYTAGFGQMGSSPQIREQQRPDPRPEEANRPARREGRSFLETAPRPMKPPAHRTSSDQNARSCNRKQISFGEMSRLSDAFHITG